MLELPDNSGDQVMMVLEPSPSMSAQPQIDDDNVEDIGDMVTAYYCEIAVDVINVTGGDGR